MEGPRPQQSSNTRYTGREEGPPRKKQAEGAAEGLKSGTETVGVCAKEEEEEGGGDERPSGVERNILKVKYLQAS